MSIKVYSFDVFDTCLVRKALKPTDVLYETARRAYTLQFADFGEQDLHDFVLHRQRAEDKARAERLTREEITLEEIYSAAQFPAWNLIDLMRIELEAEADSLGPVGSTLSYLARLRLENRRIVFISDTYLPGDFVRRQLEFHGLARESDGFYVSSEIGLTKSVGTLFEHVAAKEGVRPGEIWHCGDNGYADVFQARRRGLKASHFQSSGEKPLYQNTLERWPHFNLALRQCAGLGRFLGLRKPFDDVDENTIYRFGYELIAPFLISFCAWLLEDARQRKIGRLYFVARDGYALREICSVLAEPGDPELRYLYGSRQAWFFPSLSSFESPMPEWFYIPSHSCTARSLLARVELGDATEELTAQLGFSESEQLSAEKAKLLWEAISSSAWKGKAEERLDQARRAANAYFTAEGLYDRTTMAMVDLGWTLKTFFALRKMLEKKQNGIAPYGYFLGVSETRVTGQARASYSAYISAQSSTIEGAADAFQITRRTDVLDQALASAPHPGVVGYRFGSNGPEPVFRNSSIQESPQVKLLKKRFLDCARELATELVGAASRKEIADREFGGFWSAAFADFLRNPDARIARILSQIPVHDDQNETIQIPLCRGISPGLLISMGWQRLRGLPSRNRSFRWLEGSLVLSPSATKFAFYLGRRLPQLMKAAKRCIVQGLSS